MAVFEIRRNLDHPRIRNHQRGNRRYGDHHRRRDHHHLPTWLVEATVEKVHVELGGLVHSNWDLPRFLTLVAVRHHDTQLPIDGEFVGLHVVRLVSALVQARRVGALSAALRSELDSSAQALHLDGYALRALDTQIRQARPH